jgi:hypothetical protein
VTHRFSGASEHVANTGCTHPNEDLHELGATGAEEWHSAFSGNCLSQQSLPRTCGSPLQDTSDNMYASVNVTSDIYTSDNIYKHICHY